MSRNIYSSRLRNKISTVNVIKGGTEGSTAIEATDNLGIVSRTGFNKSGGVAGMLSNNIPSEVVPESLSVGDSYAKLIPRDISLNNPLTALGPNAVVYYSISNYDLERTYTVSAIQGSVTRLRDRIEFGMPSSGPGIFTIDGREINIPSVVSIINKPVITSVSNNTNYPINLSGLITTSAFATQAGNEDYLTSIQYDISEVSNFSTIKLTRTLLGSSGTSLAIPANSLDYSKTYYIRVRQRGYAYGWSNWSDSYTITSINPSVIAPTILTPTEGQTTNIVVSFTSDTFQAPGGSDIHYNSDWEVSKHANFSILEKSTYNDTVNKTSWTVTGLNYSYSYYVRVRYRGQSYGYGAWSATRRFQTDFPYPLKPSITSPSTGAINTETSFTLTSSAMVMVEGTNPHVSSDWEISRFSNFSTVEKSTYNDTTNKTTWTPSGLANSIQYYARVKHRSSGSKESSWSDAITFTTKSGVVVVTVATPTITSHSNGATNIDTTFAITSSLIAFTSGSGSHGSSDWEVATDSSFTNKVKTTYDDFSNITSWTVNGLSYSTSYYIRVRHKTTTNIYSAWSTGLQFTTKAVPIVLGTPSITSPSVDATNIDTTPTITSSNFTLTSGVDTHLSTDWQISRVNTFASIEVQSLNDTNNLKIWIPAGLANAVVYYVRCRYKSATGVYSTWSPSITFTTKAAVTVNTPTVTSPVGGATNVDLTVNLTSSAFSLASGVDTHTVTEWQLSIANNMSNPSLVNVTSGNLLIASYTSLSNSTTYYARCRYKTLSGVYSGWSPIVMFTTKAALIPLVTISETVSDVHTIYTPAVKNSPGQSWGPFAGEALIGHPRWQDYATKNGVDAGLLPVGAWSYHRYTIDNTQNSQAQVVNITAKFFCGIWDTCNGYLYYETVDNSVSGAVQIAGVNSGHVPDWNIYDFNLVTTLTIPAGQKRVIRIYCDSSYNGDYKYNRYAGGFKSITISHKNWV